MPFKNKPLKFPLDDSRHDSIIEWWYFNGHLQDARGNKYSFMNCLFKVDVKRVKIPFLSKIPMQTAYFSHSLISDIKNKNFHHRITPLSLLSADSFSKPFLYINYLNHPAIQSYTNCVIEQKTESLFHIKNEDLDLNLLSSKKPLLEGGKGFLNLQSSTTYYYSRTNLQTEGRIKIKNEWLEVKGISWMDHQWADKSYSKNLKDKWDWFSIQLDNQTEIVCGVYSDGKTKTQYAGISLADGRQENIQEFEAISLGKNWISPKSKAIYPLAWIIKIPAKKIELQLTAKINNQEMLAGSINYWEGPMQVEGIFDGKKVTGVGFMELYGYPSQYTNAKYIRDEIGKSASSFFSIAKK